MSEDDFEAWAKGERKRAPRATKTEEETAPHSPAETVTKWRADADEREARIRDAQENDRMPFAWRKAHAVNKERRSAARAARPSRCLCNACREV